MSDKKTDFKSLDKVTDDAWEKLSAKKIYFGHQSVGNNILDGIESIVKEYPSIKLNIVQTTRASEFAGGIFAHSAIGENTKPQTKVDSFVENLDNGIGDQADAAGMKFCYIDFNANTDVEKVFEDYKIGVEEIRKKYPLLKIFHITVPLLKVQSGPKAWVKKIIGRTLDGTKDNVKRLEFNMLLFETYDGKDPIFDLSAVQSTRPDGKRETFTLDGKTYFAMVPAYTYDGGHLNDLGKRVAAEQFLLFLLNNV